MENLNRGSSCLWQRGKRTRWSTHWLFSDTCHFCSHFLEQNKLYGQAWHPGTVGKHNCPRGGHPVSLGSSRVYDIPHAKRARFFNVCGSVLPRVWQFSFNVDTSSRKGFNTGIIFSHLEMHLFKPWHQISSDLNIPSQEIFQVYICTLCTVVFVNVLITLEMPPSTLD